MYYTDATHNVAAECMVTVGGVASFIMLAALPLAVLLTWLTVVLYRRRVIQAMRSMSPDAASAVQRAGAPATTPPSSALQFESVDSKRLSRGRCQGGGVKGSASLI